MAPGPAAGRPGACSNLEVIAADIPFATGSFAVFPGMPDQADDIWPALGGRPEFAISRQAVCRSSKLTRVWLRSPLAVSWVPALVTIPSPRLVVPVVADRLRYGFGRLRGPPIRSPLEGGGEARDDAQPCATPASSAHASRRPRGQDETVMATMVVYGLPLLPPGASGYAYRMLTLCPP